VKKLLVLILLFLLTACNNENTTDTTTTIIEKPALPAGITLVDEFKGDDGGIAIPYAKYRLANGLTVILHEDHSDPLVHVDVTYHVGSNREEVGAQALRTFLSI